MLTWEARQGFAINLVSHAHFNLWQGVQDVQLCQSDSAQTKHSCVERWGPQRGDGERTAQNGSLRREAVDHVGVSDQNQVQPTAAPPPARRHAELSPSALQQIADVLQSQQEVKPVKQEVYIRLRTLDF